MLWSRSPFGVSAGSSPAPVSRVGRSSASKLRSSERSFLLRATTAHRASRDDRSRRSSAAAFGQHPSLSGAPRRRCPLAPRNAAYREGSRAARLRRSHRDPLARSPAAPARIPPPAPPVSPTGRGHGEALTPPETRETEHDKADQPVRLWLPSKNPDYRTRR